MRFTSERHWWTRPGQRPSLDGRWLPLAALGGVLVALVFSVWRFEPSEDIAAATVVPPAEGPGDFHQLPAVHIRLQANAAGRLAAILFNGRPVRDPADLQAQIKIFRGPASEATVAAELDCDGNLRYADTQRTIDAISSCPSPDGRVKVPLVDRVKFLPQRSAKP